jgi:hypothetical protein
MNQSRLLIILGNLSTFPFHNFKLSDGRQILRSEACDTNSRVIRMHPGPTMYRTRACVGERCVQDRDVYRTGTCAGERCVQDGDMYRTGTYTGQDRTGTYAGQGRVQLGCCPIDQLTIC